MKPPVRPPPTRPAALARPAPLHRPGGRASGIVHNLSALDPVPDPLADVPEVADPQEAAALELSALAQGFRDRAKNEADRFKGETDSEHWFTVNFESREQKDAFLIAMKWVEHGDKYLDGRILANIPRPPDPFPLPKADRRYNTGKVDKALQKLR